MCCTKVYSFPILHDYKIEGHTIAIKKLHTYLGVGNDSGHLIISNKSNKVLNFVKQNPYTYPVPND